MSSGGSNWKKVAWSFNCSVPTIKTWYDDTWQQTWQNNLKMTLKVWLVQSQDLDVRMIPQIDIVMCFTYSISAMSWRYRGRCHSSIGTILECPLGTVLWSFQWFACVSTKDDSLNELCSAKKLDVTVTIYTSWWLQILSPSTMCWYKWNFFIDNSWYYGVCNGIHGTDFHRYVNNLVMDCWSTQGG